MQPIHLAIGVVEGLITFCAIYLSSMSEKHSLFIKSRSDITNSTLCFMVAALVCGGVVSAFASSYPDGLEWSIGNVAQTAPLIEPDSVHLFFDAIQSKTAIFQGYAISGMDSIFTTCVAGVLGCLMMFFITMMVIRKQSSNLL